MCEGGRVICCAVPAHTPTGPGTQHEPWTKTCCSSNWWTCLQGWPPLCASPPAGQQPRSPSKASRLSNLPGNEEGDKGETRERDGAERVWPQGPQGKPHSSSPPASPRWWWSDEGLARPIRPQERLSCVFGPGCPGPWDCPCRGGPSPGSSSKV